MSVNPEWWQKDDIRGEIEKVLFHINSSRLSGAHNGIIGCQSFFNALNRLWAAHQSSTKTLNTGDNRALSDLHTRGIPEQGRLKLSNSQQVQRLAGFQPELLIHDTLRRSTDYRPNQQIPHDLVNKASHEHRQLIRAYNQWSCDSSSEHQIALLKKLAQLLYVVRSNIAHGEKTAYGPDHLKVERNQKVCSITLPVLEVIFEVIFNDPAHRLAVYGTLAPGQANHHMIANIQGLWEDGFIVGKLHEIDGLIAFRWKTPGDKVAIKLLTSPDFPSHWQGLDRFEGPPYRRILVPIETYSGQLEIANIFEASS
jgi:gamma-glutamylcyclotransferase (GGCT)/AIG2-like uncharacterized protein YtfP